jgi:LacI family transcriptional regulator
MGQTRKSKSQSEKPSQASPEPTAERCPTMEDIASEVGLSRAAVSMGLRGDRSIPAGTRARIREAALRLGYRPNPLVSSLMSLHRQRRSVASVRTTIAFLAFHDWRQYAVYQSMFAGAKERAEEVSCLLEEFQLRTPGMTPLRMRKILETRSIHAIIVAPLPSGERTLDFDFTSFIAVGLGMSVTAPLIERVSNDHFQSAVLAVEKCIELGYRRIGLVVAESTSRRLGHRWLAGFNLAILKAGLPALPPLSPENIHEIPSQLSAWRVRHKPDVVINGHEVGHREKFENMPRSIGLVNLGTPSIDSGLSGIFQDFHLIGRTAAERTISRLYTNNFDSLQQAHIHLVAGQWVPGLSAPGPGRLRPAELL